MNAVSGKVVASCFALAGFAVAIVAGLAAEVDSAQILLRSAVAIIVCYPIGMLAGSVCQRVVQSHITAYKAAHPGADSVELAIGPIAEAPAVEVEPIVV